MHLRAICPVYRPKGPPGHGPCCTCLCVQLWAPGCSGDAASVWGQVTPQHDKHGGPHGTQEFWGSGAPTGAHSPLGGLLQFSSLTASFRVLSAGWGSEWCCHFSRLCLATRRCKRLAQGQQGTCGGEGLSVTLRLMTSTRSQWEEGAVAVQPRVLTPAATGP